MQPQEIFDTIAAHLFTQGKPAYEGRCVYRGDNHISCAVGYLIPEECYHPQMEGKDIEELIESYTHLSDKLPAFFSQHLKLLSELQGVHDALSSCVDQQRSKGFDKDILRIKLEDVAKKNELDASIVETLHPNP